MKTWRLNLGVFAFSLLQVSSVWAALPGDFNEDGLLDAADVNQFAGVILSGKYDQNFDLRPDQKIDRLDLHSWVVDHKNSWLGDLDLDGLFSTSDLVHAFQIAEYEDGIKFNSVYTDGDVNGDSEFNSSDFVAMFNAGCDVWRCYEVGPRGSTTVPESTSNAVVGLFIAFLVSGKRRRRLRINKIGAHAK